MTELTAEKRAELRKEWEAAVPQCIHRDLVLSLLDALDAAEAKREHVWERGYEAGHADSRYANFGTTPNPHSTTEAVKAKQARAKAYRPAK